MNGSFGRSRVIEQDVVGYEIGEMDGGEMV